MIQALTFDFWCTLYHYEQSPELLRLQHLRSVLDSAGRTDISDRQMLLALHKTWGAWDRVWRGEQQTFGADEWLRRFLEELQVMLPEPTFAQTVRKMVEVAAQIALPVADVVAVLSRLAERYRLGLVSDTGIIPGDGLRALMARDGLLDYFSALTFSDEFGRSKPYPTLFSATLELLNTPPQQAVHIGDLRYTDVGGAQAVGMRTVRYAGVRDDDTFFYPEADAVIYKYSELELLLEAWNSET
ncbi:MAG: HAD family hydrolase [Anaerolineae bacterium]|jgi:putative hydrolase of the HAD superfamily|nr:HAD family hydrolase [Anaerolineae bacterium]